jgi:8-oxo-dGTP diphosphatase
VNLLTVLTQPARADTVFFMKETPNTRVRHVNEIDWKTWKPTERAVLCFVRQEGRILLIHKKTGLGAGKINGPGGRIEPGETAAEAAVRETEEETGIVPRNLEKVAELHFQFLNGYGLHGTVFICGEYSGELTETEEADPFWCEEAKLPWENMWEDDPLWLPGVLQGKKVQAFFIFDDDTMLSHRVLFLDDSKDEATVQRGG